MKQKRSKTFKFVTGHILLCITIALHITGNVLQTLFASILLLYIPAPTETDHAFWYRIFCNEFIVSMGTSILLILYYSITVVNPNAISKEARKLKKRLSHSPLPTGDVSRFIALYDIMERRCEELVDSAVLNQIYENKGRRFEYAIELLMLGDPALVPLLLKVRRIHRYYECTVNCSPMTVTKEMSALAQKTEVMT